MLGLLESRGNQASGASWHSGKGVGYVKRDVRGSQLNLKSMPRKTDAVILHTRYATHGSITDNRNNHPIQSPDSTINLVHNGVIYNHDQIRPELPHKLPDVDSSVISALLQDEGLDGLSKLDGDAAIAWLSTGRQSELHIARVSHSPMVICQIKDGSFFFASTEQIMLDFLDEIKRKATFWLTMPERTGYVIRKGRIVETLLVPDLDPAYETKMTASLYDNYRWQTAGGKGSAPVASKRGSKRGIAEPNYDWQTGSEGTLWHDDDCDSYSAPEYEFQEWLDDNFLYTNGEYFTYDGYFVGDRTTMLEKFEQFRYDDFWEAKEAEINA